jgi:hypothetical protein
MDRLAEVLADMLRAAITWENEHGIPPLQKYPNIVMPLTSIHSTYTLASHNGNQKNAKDSSQIFQQHN